MGEAFPLASGEDSIELVLLRADALGAQGAGPGRRAPFSLLFRGPPAPMLPQQIHRLAHPAFGVLAIFLVPIGRDEAGVRYESVFS